MESRRQLPPGSGAGSRPTANTTGVLDFPAVDVLQRPDWYGTPVELGELFILKKNRRTAMCANYARIHSGGNCACSLAHKMTSCRRRSVGRRTKC